jgi:hypothetical protein
MDLSGNTVMRVDPILSFVWSGTSPDPRIPTYAFSARWTGQLLAAVSEPYTIYATADDGVRVYLGGQLIIDGWKDQPPTEYSSTVSLVAGLRYAVVIEYYQGWGGSQVSLSWSSPSTPKQIIPTTQLFSP